MKQTRNSNRTEDAKLLKRFISDRDEAAFSRIVQKYEGLVWTICCRILDNRCDAEDAFQATFCLLASKARRIRKPKSLSSWLYGVAFRTASSIRRQRHRDMIPYDNASDPGLTQDVLEYVAQKNENELVCAELMMMNEKYKTPLIMFYFLGESTSRIATTMGLTIAAVESRLRQAKKTLKNRLRIRGIDWDNASASIVVPALVITPSLTTSTCSCISVAVSQNGLAEVLANLLQTINTGKQIMICKFAASIGIIGIASLGALSHGIGSGSANSQQPTVFQETGEVSSVVISTRFAEDDDDSNSTSHFEHIHNHAWTLLGHITGLFHEPYLQESDSLVEPSDGSGVSLSFVGVDSEYFNIESNFELGSGTDIGISIDVEIGSRDDASELEAEANEETESFDLKLPSLNGSTTFKTESSLPNSSGVHTVIVK